MNAARQHNEWLSLVERSGPFISLPVLLRVFPQGLDQRDPDRVARLREAYDEWRQRGFTESALHHSWIRHVLSSVLEYQAGLLAEGQAIPAGLETALPVLGETLRPDLVLKHPSLDAPPVLLIVTYTPDQNLNKPVNGKIWKASPATRMTELLRATAVSIGLVTNGEEWMLVSARPKETSGFATWSADLWMQEPLTLRAFHSLLHLRRLVGVAPPDTLPALLVESSRDQQEVTDQLGHQVRKAVEVLVQAFDQIDAESGRRLLAGVSEKELYDSALTTMMRLVFLFSAEERGLLLLGDPLYDQNYAVSTLSESLRERADQQGEEVLERRQDAWCRLLATFRAVYGGVEHEAMRLPPYGGTLFDPDKYPFLEGRGSGSSWRTAPAHPVPINNRVVLHLLEALQFLRVKAGGGASETRRLSFTELGVEQIGHVYEGLLDHTARRADETFLGLAGSKDKEPEVPLSALEDASVLGIGALLALLREETGRSASVLERLVGGDPDVDEHGLLAACGQDAELALRTRPFAALLRSDSFGRLAVVRPSQVFVTKGSDRRSTGTHYTPPSLTEPIVRYTLEPLVYVGVREGMPQSEWTLKTPKEILGLKVCDMAMGSGAFLVEVCRYLAERLVESWENSERAHPGSFVVTPDGALSVGSPAERLLPIDASERIAVARRYVADRCLYGVDVNPMAVEMAKLSIWLTTSQRDRPFTFLNHALKHGDSLLGVNSVRQIENFSLRSDERQGTFATANLSRFVEQASEKRRALEQLPSNDQIQIEAKETLYAEAESSTGKIKALADALVAFELRDLDGSAYEAERTVAADQAEKAMQRSISEFRDYACDQLRGRQTFHWPVEFPEVFANGGFDSFIGNPPFIGGHDISGLYGHDYRSWLARNLFGKKAGLADICAFFAVRAHGLARSPGTVGLVATNSITEGDSRKVALDRIVEGGSHIIRAWPDMKWPGDAAVVVSPFVVLLGTWSGETLSTTLCDQATLAPQPLTINQDQCFVGCYVLGDYFELDDSTARGLLASGSEADVVILPYINGEEFNAFPDMRPRRWIVSFWDWDEETARGQNQVFDHLETAYAQHREGVSGSTDERKWWLYARSRPALYHALAMGHRFMRHPPGWRGDQRRPVEALVKAKTSETWAFGFMPAATILDQALTVFASGDRGLFAIVQSTLHEVWARDAGAGSKMKTDLRYAPTTFESFPMPESREGLVSIGKAYERHRFGVMESRRLGLTDVYGRFNDRRETGEDIVRLRAIHAEMDQAVLAAYGWGDLDLGHGFHPTRRGGRFTMGERARETVLRRLLNLNHERFVKESAEVASTAVQAKTRKDVSRSTGPSRARRPLLD